jgi:hypothetical protein
MNKLDATKMKISLTKFSAIKRYLHLEKSFSRDGCLDQVNYIYLANKGSSLEKSFKACMSQASAEKVAVSIFIVARSKAGAFSAIFSN